MKWNCDRIISVQRFIGKKTKNLEHLFFLYRPWNLFSPQLSCCLLGATKQIKGLYFSINNCITKSWEEEQLLEFNEITVL